jgi:hypothetical protein
MMSNQDNEKTIKLNVVKDEQTRTEKRKLRKRKERQENTTTHESDSTSVLKSPRPKRLFPIWARLLVVAGLIVLSLFAGLMFGYGIIGDGEPTDALKWETFQHILDLINKE